MMLNYRVGTSPSLSRPFYLSTVPCISQTPCGPRPSHISQPNYPQIYQNRSSTGSTTRGPSRPTAQSLWKGRPNPVSPRDPIFQDPATLSHSRKLPQALFSPPSTQTHGPILTRNSKKSILFRMSLVVFRRRILYMDRQILWCQLS